MRNSGKIKGQKNQYLVDIKPNSNTQYTEIRSKGMSSLMEMKKFKPGGVASKQNNYVQAQQMSYQGGGKRKQANFRDRATKQFNPGMFADANPMNMKSPFLSKTLKGMFSQNKKKKSSGGSRQRRDSAKGKKRSTSKGNKKNTQTSADGIFSPKNAMFNNKKLSYGGAGKPQQAMRGGQSKGYSRNMGSGLTGNYTNKPNAGGNWGSFGGSRFRTQQNMNVAGSHNTGGSGYYAREKNMLN